MEASIFVCKVGSYSSVDTNPVVHHRLCLYISSKDNQQRECYK